MTHAVRSDRTARTSRGRQAVEPLVSTIPGTEKSTRERILRLVVEDGPVSVVELATVLDLTPAGVRRHVVALEESGQIAVHHAPAGGSPRRGRPARRYVATDRAQAGLSSAYADLAAEALQYLSTLAGEDAVQEFAERRVRELELRLADDVEAAGSDLVARTAALAAGLSAEGYAASSRPALHGRAVQICQGHCPVQHVAAQFPQLCEAETQLFARLLGVHVQRLSTLAAGAHVCTTHVPTAPISTIPVRTTEHGSTTDH